jgi:hypothetical protein
MSRAETRTRLDWIDEYRDGFLMALFVDDEQATRRLTEWPDMDLPIDDGTWELNDADNKAQVALAFVLRGEPEVRVSEVVERIRSSKRKRAVVFCDAVEAIVRNDPVAFARGLKDLCDRYRKSAPALPRIERLEWPEPCMDGSILWHVARRAGIDLPRLPERQLDWIVR